MSTRVMDVCWSVQLPTVQKAVLISLADQANDEGETWPSVGTLARRVCVSDRSVQTAIRGLERRGLLRVEHRKRKNGSSTSNHYFIDLSECRALARGVKDVREGSEPASPPEPSIEPNTNPPSPHKCGGAQAVEQYSLVEWLRECKRTGRKALGGNDRALRFLHDDEGELALLHWKRFKACFETSPIRKSEEGWRRRFRQAVRSNEFGLWCEDGRQRVATDEARRTMQEEQNVERAPIAAGPPERLQ